jgi:hypothetical protein
VPWSASSKLSGSLPQAWKSQCAATRRVLANVPTYMVFDDHDVTDDWNLTRERREAVVAGRALRARSRLRACWASSTGRRFVANALACSYLRLARRPRGELPASRASSAGGSRSRQVRSFQAVRYITANSPEVRRWLSTSGPGSRARSAASSVRPPSGTCDSGGQPGIERSSPAPMSALAIYRTCPTSGPATSSA